MSAVEAGIAGAGQRGRSIEASTLRHAVTLVCAIFRLCAISSEVDRHCWEDSPSHARLLVPGVSLIEAEQETVVRPDRVLVSPQALGGRAIRVSLRDTH